MIEECTGNSWGWAVTLKGNRAAVKARAQAIREGTDDMMTAHMSATRDGQHVVMMEFTKTEGAA